MLVVITNRKPTAKLPVSITKKPIAFIGNQLAKKSTEHKDRNYIVKVINQDNVTGTNYSIHSKQLEYYPRDQLPSLFEGTSKPELSRPWVIYVHGHHQDPEENIQKSLTIERLYNVNVLAFSWPSHPYVMPANTKTTLKAIKKAVINAVGVTWWQNILLSKAWDLGQGLYETWENYPIAAKNADSSASDFIACLQLFKSHIKPLLPNDTIPSLLVHSQGHQLLEEAMASDTSLPLEFSNVLLHEADANASNHLNWAPRLTGICHRVYITLNTNDSVLWASNARNSAMGEANPERLGQTSRYFIQHDSIHYIDLSEMPCLGEITGCEYEHAYYLAGSDKIIEEVVNFIKGCVQGADRLLPMNPSRAFKGYLKMKTKYNIYKLEWIVLDADRGQYEGENGHDEVTRSSKTFQAPEDRE